MKIGVVAQAAGVSCDTLRFYEKLGLIRATRAENGYRHYAQETGQLVIYIRTAQKLGFSLADIGANMATVWCAPDPDAAVAELLAAKGADHRRAHRGATGPQERTVPAIAAAMPAVARNDLINAPPVAWPATPPG